MILNWMKQRQCTTLGVMWYRHRLWGCGQIGTQPSKVLNRPTPTPPQFRGRIRRLCVRGPWLALGGRTYTRPQQSRFRRGLRGQLHWVTAQRRSAEDGSRRAPELRHSLRPPAARLQSTGPPPARAQRLPWECALQPAAHLASFHRGESACHCPWHHLSCLF